MAALYPITGRFVELMRLIEDADGDLDAANMLGVTLGAELDAAEWEQDGAVAASVAFQRRMKMEILEAENRIRHFQNLIEMRQRALERECESLKQHLIATGQTRIETTAGDVVSVQRNGGKLPVVPTHGDTFDAATLPDQYVRVRREPDRDAIRAALEAGESLPFARFGERGTHLRIR